MDVMRVLQMKWKNKVGENVSIFVI
jgi:hypothetical protein